MKQSIVMPLWSESNRNFKGIRKKRDMSKGHGKVKVYTPEEIQEYVEAKQRTK